MSITDPVNENLGDNTDIVFLPEGTPTFDVEMNIISSSPTINFTLLDSNPSDPAIHYKIEDQTACLFVKPGEPRIIRIKLSSNWDWTFDETILMVSKGDYRNYPARLVEGSGDRIAEIHAYPCGLNPKPGELGRDDKLDLIVKMRQELGRPVTLKIDPITENPPPGGSSFDPTHGPVPIA